MYTNRSRRTTAAALVMVAICFSGVAFAQGFELVTDGDRSYGTPNLPSVTPWAADETFVWGEVRFFEGNNQTYAGGVRAGVGEGSEAQFTLFTMDTTAERADGTKIRSRGTLLGLNYKWLALERDQMRFSVMPGFDFPIRSLEAENRATGEVASSNNLIPVISVPIEWLGEGGTTWRVVPRYVGFDTAPELSTGGTIDGLSQCVAIGLGVLHEQPRYSLMADLQIVVIGDNATNVDTGEPTREMVWSAGGSWHGFDSPVRIDLFATNAFGATGATSLMATHDSIGVGLRVSGEF